MRDIAFSYIYNSVINNQISFSDRISQVFIQFLHINNNLKDEYYEKDENGLYVKTLPKHIYEIKDSIKKYPDLIYTQKAYLEIYDSLVDVMGVTNLQKYVDQDTLIEDVEKLFSNPNTGPVALGLLLSANVHKHLLRYDTINNRFLEIELLNPTLEIKGEIDISLTEPVRKSIFGRIYDVLSWETLRSGTPYKFGLIQTKPKERELQFDKVFRINSKVNNDNYRSAAITYNLTKGDVDPLPSIEASELMLSDSQNLYDELKSDFKKYLNLYKFNPHYGNDRLQIAFQKFEQFKKNLIPFNKDVALFSLGGQAYNNHISKAHFKFWKSSLFDFASTKAKIVHKQLSQYSEQPIDYYDDLYYLTARNIIEKERKIRERGIAPPQ
jgi:hypothetical protein